MSEYKYTGYSEWDMGAGRRERIGADCRRIYEQSGGEQYQKAAARIAELEAENARLEAEVREYKRIVLNALGYDPLEKE